MELRMRTEDLIPRRNGPPQPRSDGRSLSRYRMRTSSGTGGGSMRERRICTQSRSYWEEYDLQACGFARMRDCPCSTFHVRKSRVVEHCAGCAAWNNKV